MQQRPQVKAHVFKPFETVNRRLFLTSCAAAPLPLFAEQDDSTTTNSATHLAGRLPNSTQVSLAYRTDSTIETTPDDAVEAEFNVSPENKGPKVKFDTVYFKEKSFLVETKYAEQQFEVHNADDHIIDEIVVQLHTVPLESRTSQVIAKLHHRVARHAASFNSSPSDQLTDRVDTAEYVEQISDQRWSGRRLSTSKYSQVYHDGH
jgi:hypothetical protein